MAGLVLDRAASAARRNQARAPTRRRQDQRLRGDRQNGATAGRSAMLDLYTCSVAPVSMKPSRPLRSSGLSEDGSAAMALLDGLCPAASSVEPATAHRTMVRVASGLTGGRDHRRHDGRPCFAAFVSPREQRLVVGRSAVEAAGCGGEPVASMR